MRICLHFWLLTQYVLYEDKALLASPSQCSVLKLIVSLQKLVLCVILLSSASNLSALLKQKLSSVVNQLF